MEHPFRGGGGRISALERIETPEDGMQRSVGLSDSLRARLQDGEGQYMQEEQLNPNVGEGSSRGIPQQETQRTPASQRLGSSSDRKRNPPRKAAKKAL